MAMPSRPCPESMRLKATKQHFRTGICYFRVLPWVTKAEHMRSLLKSSGFMPPSHLKEPCETLSTFIRQSGTELKAWARARHR